MLECVLYQKQPQNFRKKMQVQRYISTITIEQCHISKALLTFFKCLKHEKGIMNPLFQDDNFTLHSSKIVPYLLEVNDGDITHQTWNATSQSLNFIGKFWDFVRTSYYEVYHFRCHIKVNVSWSRLNMIRMRHRNALIACPR